MDVPVSGFDPSADLAGSNGSMDITKVNLLDSDGCDTIFEENSNMIDGDNDVIIKNNDIVDNNNSKTVQCRPLVKVTHLSDDSDSDNDSSSEDEQTECKIPLSQPRQQSSLDQEVPDADRKPPQHSWSDSYSSVPVETIPLTTTSTNSCTSSSVKSTSEPSLVNGCNSEEQTSLSQELFGDFDDNLSHLSVSDSSSCCSQSSLGSVDDLADLLRSDTQLYNADDVLLKDSGAKSNTVNSGGDVTEVGANIEDTQLYADSDILQDNGTVVNGDAIEEGPNADDLVLDGIAGKNSEKDIETTIFVNLESQSTSEADNISAQTRDLGNESQEMPHLPCGGDQEEHSTTSFVSQAIVHHQKSDAIELGNRTPPVTISVSDTETSVVTAVCEGPTVFLPRIEVEAAPADTASEDSDCEMDVSFSTLFGDEFQAISPLPPSPFNSHICRCPSTPLSPLPPSPVKRQPLSPLPQTPHKDLKSISPLSPSPVSACPAAISPIPPTPISLNRAHHEISSVDSVSPEEVSRDNDTSPVQFDDAAPVNVHVPKPCSLSVSVHASSELISSNVSPIMISSTESPSPKKGKLRVSETSPFSPLTFVLPSSVEAASVFDNTLEIAPTNAVPSTTESNSSSPPRLSFTSAESVSCDCTPTTADSGTLSGTCTCKASPTSPTNLVHGSAKTATVPVFEAVPLTRSIEVAREAAVTMSSTDEEAISLSDGFKEEEKLNGDKPKGEDSHSNKPTEAVNGFEAEGKLNSDIIEDATSNVNVEELAGTTSLDKHVEEDNKRNSDGGRSTLSSQVIKTEENPGNLTSGSLGLDSSNTDQGTKSDELTMVTQTTRSTEHPNVKSEKKDNDDEFIELFGESDFDLLDDHKAVSDSTPLSSGGGCSTKSPVEEGEVEDSSDEEGEEAIKLIPPPIVKNNNQSLQMQISDLPLVLSQQKRTPTVSIQPHSHALCPQVPPPAINRTSIAINRSLQVANNPSTATTFDDLLNTFCPKTRSGKKAATATYNATAKTTLLHGSPEKPTPLARLLSAARSKPKRTNPATKPNAAAFIGVQSVSSANSGSSIASCDGKISPPAVSKGQKDDLSESRVGGKGKRNVPKRFERLVSTEEPASKRQKLENVASNDCQPSENGAEEEEDEAKEAGALNSPPEATSPRNLPGYQLRTRNVVKFQVWPSRKRSTSSSSGNSVSGGGEEQEQPTKKRKRRTSSVVCGSPEAKKKTVKLETDDASAIKKEEGVALIIESKLPSLSETISSNMTQEQISVHIDSQKASKPIHPHDDATVTDTDLSSSVPPVSISPLPMTTSILADSCHLDTASDAGDSDQPLMIGELESLLDGEVYEDDEVSLPSLPPQSQPSPLTINSRSSRSLKPHIRKTDSATGQEEDQTPASSPKTGPDAISSKQIQSFSEQKTKATLNTSTSTTQVHVPPLSSPHHQVGPISLPSASTQSVSVGYGQPQQTPLPEYKPHNSLMTNAPQSSKSAGPSSSSLVNLDNDDNDDIFSTSLPILEKSKAISQQLTTQTTTAAQRSGATCIGAEGTQHGGGHPGISLAQGALTLSMKSPLPLPHWLVSAMTRVQSKHEHCAASGAGLSKKKKRGNGE